MLVFCLLVWWKGGAARGYAVCLLLGALVGVGIRETTDARLAKIQGSYAGQEAVLTAEVESIGRAYGAGRVSAVLRVETVDGEAVRFRVECVSLPRCEAGGRIRGRFALDLPDATQRLSDYADGIALSAEYQSGMLRLGPGRSFRARTARLQAALSRALRGGMAENTGGVLAAMAAGDKSHLSSALRSAYRGAGLSHVLVVSGLHVTIFCGLLDALPRRERERSRAYRRARSLLRAGTALLLVGITGVTPSVLRAAVAVWISSLGVWLGGPADTLTSLGAAGVLMCLGNGYAVCDVGFELSFAAVLGTLAGGVCAKRGRKAYYNKKKRQGKKPSRPVLLLRRLAGGVWDALCVSFCASAATFPVLVLRGMSATVWAVVSGVAVLWMVGPMLGLSLGAALLGLAAQNFGSLPLFEILRRPIAFCAEGLAFGMNEWAFRVSGLPGASLWFDGGYAALVCLVLFLLCAAAMRWNVRLRAALPTVVLLAALASGLETALSWNVVNIELVGTQAAPAVVITRREQAVVLFRGSSITQRAVETQLEKRGVKTGGTAGGPADAAGDALRSESRNAHRSRCAGCGHHPPRRLRRGGLGALPHPAGLHRPADHRRAALCHGKRHRPPCKAHPGRVAAGVDGAAGQHPVHRLPDPEPQSTAGCGRATPRPSPVCASASQGERFSKRAEYDKIRPSP